MSTPSGFNFEYLSGCLLVRATGRFMIDQKEAAIKEIAEALNAQSVNAALVDMREVEGPYTFMDRYQLGELAGRYLSKIPLAVLALENQTDKQRIGQLVAVNRGAKMEVFTDPDAAMAWLKKHQSAGK